MDGFYSFCQKHVDVVADHDFFAGIEPRAEDVQESLLQITRSQSSGSVYVLV